MKVIASSRNENIKRINEIYKVLKDNDFGYLIGGNTFFRRFPLLRSRKSEKEESYLDETAPIRIRKVFEQLGPAYIKFGQMLSTRPDLVGIEIANELQKLRDDTPATPFDEMKAVIEEELGSPLEEIFSDFDETPLGSASIGQVYRAKLKSNGEEVAVKVQKPNSREIIESDVRIMKFLANRMDRYISVTRTYNLPAMISEFERSIFKEINFLEETMNLQNFSRNFRSVVYIKIPDVYLDYCTEKVITMELIRGIKITDLIKGDYPDINKKKIANYGVKYYFKQIMIDGFFHADPHPGNLIVTEDKKLCYIDAGMMGILNEDFKEDLAELILLLISGNTNNIVHQLMYMGVISPSQNTPELRADIDGLMNLYYGAELRNMDGAMEDLLNAMIKNNVILPKEFVMIGRGIALIEDTGKKLDPNFNAATELRTLSRQIISNKYKPKRIGKVSLNYMLQLEHLAKDLPDTIRSTVSKIEEGDIEVRLKHEEISQLTNQLSVALIISSLIIGSSLAIIGNAGPKLFGMSGVGLIGFVFSAVLGAFLIIEYMIERD